MRSWRRQSRHIRCNGKVKGLHSAGKRVIGWIKQYSQCFLQQCQRLLGREVMPGHAGRKGLQQRGRAGPACGLSVQTLGPGALAVTPPRRPGTGPPVHQDKLHPPLPAPLGRPAWSQDPSCLLPLPLPCCSRRVCGVTRLAARLGPSPPAGDALVSLLRSTCVTQR